MVGRVQIDGDRLRTVDFDDLLRFAEKTVDDGRAAFVRNETQRFVEREAARF